MMNQDERAVSPVIGVLLMVAVTVVLSSVVAVAVFQYEDALIEPRPQVAFDADYDQHEGTLTLYPDYSNGVEWDRIQIRDNSGNTVNWTDIAPPRREATINGSSSLSAPADGDTYRITYEGENVSYTLQVIEL